MAIALLILLAQQEIQAEVQRHVAKLDSDDPHERQDAVAALVRLQSPAIPWLEPFTRHRNPEIASRTAEALETIHRTDPLMLVRRHPRRISIDVNNLFLHKAVVQIFEGFPASPVINLSQPLPQVSLKLESATYWEAVLALARQSGNGLFINCGEVQYNHAKNPIHHAQGPFLISAYHGLQNNLSQITLWIAAEPDWQPVSAQFDLASIEDDQGRNVREEHFPQTCSPPSRFGKHFEQQLAGWSVRNLAARRPIRIRGTVRVWMPTKVQGAKFDLKNFQEPVERNVGDCRVTLAEFSQDAARFKMWFKGPESRGGRFKDELWVMWRNEHSGSRDIEVTSYYGWHGLHGLGMGYVRDCTHVACLRVLETEAIQIPVDLVISE